MLIQDFEKQRLNRSNNMQFDKESPYNNLPLLPPDNELYESIEIFKSLTEARAILAELKGRTPVIPNPLMLINTLVLQEAKDSSTIENIVTSRDILFKAFSSSRMKVDAATKEVLQYREAIWTSFNALKVNNDFSDELIKDIFGKITEQENNYRSGQVYIGNEFAVTYTPPESGDIISSKMKNWIDFANQNKTIDPLIRMALLHYQFESIHPFEDGNGRTGRILNVLFLCQAGLLDLPILYLSKYILEYKSEYYRLLREVTEKQNWQNWIMFMLEAVKQTAGFTLGKVNAIFDLFTETRHRVRNEAKEIYSRELIELIFSQPYCKISTLEEFGIVSSRNTASKYLNRLQQMGILKLEKEGRESLYRNVGLYDILSKG
jgi:Fic family protein